jgi:hypothetical protein
LYFSIVDCRENIKKLFSRVELINLARKSDYMGAVITASPVWTRPTTVSVLDAPQYAEYTFSLLRQFESPEGQEKLALLGETALGSGSGSPDQPPGKRLGASPQILSAKASTFQPGGPAPSNAPMGQNRAPVPQEDFRGGPAGFKPQGGMPVNAPPPQYARPGAPQQQPQYAQYPGQGPPAGQYPGANMVPSGGYPGQQQAPSRQPYMDGRGYADYGHPEDFRQPPYQHVPPPQMPQRPLYPPHASQMQGYHNAPQPPAMPQYPPHQQQYQQGYAREGPYSNQSPPPQAAYGPPGPPQYPGQGQNQGRPQLSQHMPPQYGAGDSRDPRDLRSQNPAQHSAPQRNVHPAHPLTSGMPSGPPGGRPFDPTAAALAAAAERRYPVNQLQSSQQFDPKNRRPNDPPSGPMRQEQPQGQYGRPDLGSVPRNGATAPRVQEKERYDATLSARYAPDERTAQDNRSQAEGRYVPSLTIPSGSMTGRPAESQRYSEDSRYPSGSASARYPTADERLTVQQQPQHAAPASDSAPLDFSVRVSEERSAAPASRSSGLPLGLKLDLQPRFAEDRYLLSENDPIVDFAAPQTSARQQPPAQAAIGKGDKSARRGSDGTLHISPRDVAQNSTASAQPKKSPVVPLIPLEGISGFSSSSASSSDYGNALHSDRSSVFLGTGRSDILADTGRSTIVPTGGNTAGSLFGVLGTGRSSATNAFGLSAASMPNTSRSMGDFAAHRGLDSGDDFRGSLYGDNTARSDDMAGLCLSSRVADDMLETPGRVSTLTEANLAEAQPTNRLGYMGLEDLRRGPGVPLATIRSAAPSSNGSQPARSSSEFDLLLERINADSLGNQARRNSSSSGSSNVPYLADFAPPNSARGSSGRGSNASLGHLMDGLDFGHPLISPRQQLTPRREPSMSLLGSIAETPPSPDRSAHKSMTASRALPLGLLSSPGDATGLPAANAQGQNAYMQRLFNNDPTDTSSGLE